MISMFCSLDHLLCPDCDKCMDYKRHRGKVMWYCSKCKIYRKKYGYLKMIYNKN